MLMWLWQQRSSMLLHTYTNTTRLIWRWLHSFCIQSSPFCVNLPTQVHWLGASRLPRSEPRPLSSRLHFTLSVLSLCLITRRSMLTVNLLGGERDWEIKFILNSFPLMWQLHPLPPSLSLTSSLLSQQHSTESVPKHI